VISGAEAARLDERSALDLLFLPGLSTAAAVSRISGRGVGLDVVKTNVERIGGTVEVVTRQGAGTTFRISIPSPPLTNGNGRPPNEPAAAEL
jgi:two-component system chemotaxis sensor kinase CheA